MGKEKVEPRYDLECDNCGQSPVVTTVNEEGETMWSSEMCGPCTFGEASCIDPENWGEVAEVLDD